MVKEIYKECINFIEIIKENLYRLNDTEYEMWIPEFPNGACGNASMLLYLFLEEKLNIKCNVIRVDSPSHCWLRYKKIDIDITANQDMFQENKDIIVKITSPWHKDKWTKVERGSIPTDDDREIYKLIFHFKDEN